MPMLSEEMQNAEQSDLPEQATGVLRRTQIIVFAMVMGILMIAGILLSVVDGELKNDLGLLGQLGLAMAGGSLVMSVVIPGVLKSGRGGEHALELWSRQVVIGSALLEGGAVMNLIAMLVDECWYSLAAAGAVTAVLLLRFPTKSRLRVWLQLRQQDGDSGA